MHLNLAEDIIFKFIYTKIIRVNIRKGAMKTGKNEKSELGSFLMSKTMQWKLMFDFWLDSDRLHKWNKNSSWLRHVKQGANQWEVKYAQYADVESIWNFNYYFFVIRLKSDLWFESLQTIRDKSLKSNQMEKMQICSGKKRLKNKMRENRWTFWIDLYNQLKSN